MKQNYATGLLLALLLSLLMLAQVHAQTVLSGAVKDARGDALIGVNVLVDKTTRGTVTDMDGRFSIQVNRGERLRFSYMGYKTLYMAYTGQTQLQVVLEDDAQQLEDVVVTALGVEKSNAKIGYAVTEVKGASLATANTISPIAALQGRVAGVDINLSGTSGVQSSPNIVIRGTKSLKGASQPIFVIDGIVMTNNVADPQGVDWGSQLKNLNPDDYESITVLKGAAATALYGSRGANGAIVIVSKKGRKAQGIGVEVGHTYQVERIYDSHLALQNKYGAGSWANEGGLPASGKLAATAYSFGPLMTGQPVQMPYVTDGSTTPYSAQPDNWKALYQDGAYFNTNVALSGGGEYGTFRLSYSNTHNKGVMPSNAFDRNSLALRGTTNINKIFSADYGVSYAKSKALNPSSQGRWQGANIGRILTYGLPRNFDVEHYKQYYRDPVTSAVRYQNYGLWNELSSLLHRKDYVDNSRKEETFLFNLDLKAKVSDKLDFLLKGNYNLYKTFSETEEWGTGDYFSGGYYGTQGSYNDSYNLLAMAHYAQKIGDWEFDGRLATEVYGNGRSENWGRGTSGGLIVPGVFNFGNSLNEVRPWLSRGGDNNLVVGVSGIVNVSWRDQLNLEVTARQDWLSSLLYPSNVNGGQNNYGVFYPSANLSWVASETFKQSMPSWLSYAKMRASVARVGIGTAPFETNTSGFVQGTMRDYRAGSVVIATPINANLMPILNLKPELQQSVELGADIRFFNDRLGLDVAWYNFNTYNQILAVDNTKESGTTKRIINAGNIRNSGIELLLTGTPVETRDFTWNMSLNFTRNRGKVVELHPEVKEYQLMGEYEGAQVWAYEGGPLGMMTSGSATAYYQATDAEGKPVNDPRNGMPIVNFHDKAGTVDYYYYASEGEMGRYNSTYKRTPLGSVQPDFLYGFNNQLRYKQFDLNIQLDGRVGGSIYSSSYALGMQRGILEESLQFRDKEHGGLPRTNKVTGEIEYNGVVPNLVFDNGMKLTSVKTGEVMDVSGKTYKELYEAGHLEPMYAPAYYLLNYGWSYNPQAAVMKNTWLMLREISLGYTLPAKLVRKAGLQSARVGVTGRNLVYLYNGLKGHMNPASIQGNNPFAPVEYGGTPYSRTFAFFVNLSL